MITGFVLAFIGGVVTGILGQKAQVPAPLNYACGGIVGMAIVVVCQSAGLP